MSMQCALANMLPPLFFLAIGFFMAMIGPGVMKNPNEYSVAALILSAVGFALFAYAKVQNIEKGHIVSFGSAKMSRIQRWLYRGGYALMLVGLLVTLLLLITIIIWD